jgi:uncharacterized protein
MSTPPVLKVSNPARNSVLVETGSVADNMVTRVIGLMGKTGLEPGRGLLIVPCNSIHSCFMKFRFDAVFLDRDYKVLHLIEDMGPWRASKMVWGAQSVLELPSGVIQATGTQIGDRLSVEGYKA